MEKGMNKTTMTWSCCQKDCSSIYWTANSTMNELLEMTMSKLIRSKAYQFIGSKVYGIIFQKLPRQLLSMTTVNVMDMDLQKRIAMAQDMDIQIDDTMNI